MFDMQDIVRHLPGVGVSSDGRFGNNGYSMRGVDKDRVAISVDGIPQGETFDNLIYKGYGYFNGSINNIETDHLKTVLIAKGADSLFMGSGAWRQRAVCQQRSQRSDSIGQ
ncbi:TonB-dependent receptor plug domain-containing protein [Edwardsiella anguillarum]|nr:TonB-dependent receptor plug domain-containing protein [Edwardsiella anguillarum]